MYGVESNDYGPMAFAGFHRYGVTDALTLGIHGEGKSGLFNVGPTARIVLGAAGLLNMAGAVSENDGHTGVAALVSYSYLGEHWNAGLLVRKESQNYSGARAMWRREVPSTGVTTRPPRRSAIRRRYLVRSRAGSPRTRPIRGRTANRPA